VFTDPYLNLDPWILWVAGLGFGFLPSLIWGVKGGLSSLGVLAILVFIGGFLTMFTLWLAAIVIGPVAATGGWAGLAARVRG
jgi:hypothetical protein